MADSWNMWFSQNDDYNTDCQAWDGDDTVKIYTADFETTTDLDDCRVWAFAICDVDNPENVIYGTSIERFFEVCKALPNCRIYFHNLAFDASFMLDWMLRNNYRWEDDRFPRYTYGFTTIISDMNQLYSIRVNFGRKHTVTFWDSLKIIPLSIAAEAKAFGLTMEKGDLDYTAHREVGHQLTAEEMDYIRRDVQIDAQALRITLESGMDSMTVGSCALADYKDMLGGDRGFRHHFPKLEPEADAFIRMSYRGGFTYVNPKYASVTIGEGVSYDVNSLYPSVMSSCEGELLPYGNPKWFYGHPSPSDLYPLWIAQVRCAFKIREGRIPCIQLKGNLSFVPTEYIRDSLGVVTLTVTSVDWHLITQQYDVEVEEWIGGYQFKASATLFAQYVGKWVEVKNAATVTGNHGQRTIAKLMLNSLYGKFATKLKVRSRKPVIEEDVLRYVDIPETDRDGVYLPVGCFVTAWARYKTITTAQACGDRFVYSDTDSVKVVGTEPIEGMWVDPIALGAWKDEGHFTRFKALRAKTYIAEYPDEDGSHIEVHVAGMPSRCHSQVTFENFRLGAEYEGKLYQRRVRGGIVLVEDGFRIKE